MSEIFTVGTKAGKAQLPPSAEPGCRRGPEEASMRRLPLFPVVCPNFEGVVEELMRYPLRRAVNTDANELSQMFAKVDMVLHMSFLAQGRSHFCREHVPST